MSTRAIVSGALCRAPTRKVSKAGKPYVIATIREGFGEGVRWWKVFAWSEDVGDELIQLADGEPISIAGEIEAEIYSPEGCDPRISWRVNADAILSARKHKDQRRPRDQPQAKPPRRSTREEAPNVSAS